MSGEYISRETLRGLMYTEAFERDTGLQRWDSGLWIRYKLFENCIEAIPAADVVERPLWIPVTERLPEKRKWVLCRCEANIMEVLRWENNEWYHDPMHVYYPSFVTHWMPLPNPPKEKV